MSIKQSTEVNMTGNYPPGPDSKFMGANLGFRFSKDPLAFGLELLKRDERFQYAHFGPKHLYFALSPDIVHEVLVSQAKKFNKPRLQKKAFGKFNGNGLVNSDGDYWKRQRKLIQPAFHHKRIRTYANVIVDMTRQRIASWQPGQAINIQTEMSRITLDVVAKTLFNTDVRAEAERIGEAVHLVQQKAFREMSALFTLPDWVPLPYKQRENHAIADLRGLILRRIQERRASGEDRGDLLSMLLLARDEDGSGMSDEQALDESVTLLLAGHETTATALTWTWYLLAAHSDIETKLLCDNDTLLANRLPTFDDVPHLRYATMIVKESMRLYPPTWMYSREAVEPVEIGGYRLPIGAMVSLFPYVIQRDPYLWDQPDEFIPERFVPDLEEERPGYAYFPFGGGPRVCIGNSFAMMEMPLIIATILQQFRLALAPGQGTPVPEPLIALRPKDGIRMIVQPRERIDAPEKAATFAEAY
jgi:cytochrome P450